MQPMVFTGPTASEISDNSVIGYHCLAALELKSEQISSSMCQKSSDDGVTWSHPDTAHEDGRHLDYNPQSSKLWLKHAVI